MPRTLELTPGVSKPGERILYLWSLPPGFDAAKKNAIEVYWLGQICIAGMDYEIHWDERESCFFLHWLAVSELQPGYPLRIVAVVD